MSAPELREMLVALPGAVGTDIYRRHQWVWRAMHAHAQHGSAFVFGAVSERLLCVRSDRLPRGAPSALTDGRHRLAVVAARRGGQRMKPVEASAAGDWVTALLWQHGMRVDGLQVLAQWTARGEKPGPSGGGSGMLIALPIVEVTMNVQIVQRVKAMAAWSQGIGRGKRFGFGMLQRAS